MSLILVRVFMKTMKMMTATKAANMRKSRNTQKTRFARFASVAYKAYIARATGFTALLILAVVSLTGCLQINIGIGISDRFDAYLTYDIKLDVSEVDPQYHEILANALNKWGWHYQEELDFIVGLSTDSDIYTLTMKQSTQNADLQEAFESLKAMLTDEKMTPFMQVDMVMEHYPRRDSYLISAMLDIDYIIQQSGYEELPPDLLPELEKAIEASSGKIVLTVPVIEIDSHSHAVTDPYYAMAEMTVPIKFDDLTEFELRGSINYSEEGRQIGTTAEIIENLTKTRNIVILCAGSVLGILLIALTVSLVKRRKARAVAK